MSRHPERSGLKLILLAAIFGIVVVFFWWRFVTAPVDASSLDTTIFVIPKGQAVDIIGQRLKEAGLIRSTTAFKLVVLKNGLAKKIQAGDFRLSQSMDTVTIAAQLTHGTLDIWVTLLEGWRREEMAAKIAQEFSGRGLSFDTPGFIAATEDEEGYLFPDTYLIPREASSATIAKLLRDTFDQKVDLISSNQSGLTSSQVVILASIIEREVATDNDRGVVAGILIKRLRADWPLQADATVQYALGSLRCQPIKLDCPWWEPNLTRDDIARATPYNTYDNLGLPPTPIANPSLASIKAVLNPELSPYWYYISDREGAIHYAESIAEHNANVAQYLRK